MASSGNLAFFETFDDDALHCLIEDIFAVDSLWSIELKLDAVEEC